MSQKPVKSPRKQPKPFVRKNIPINIWDDYTEDEHLPDGQKQATHAYIEDGEKDTEELLAFQRRALDYLAERIKELPMAAQLPVEYVARNTWYTEEGQEGDWNYRISQGSSYEPQINFAHLPHALRETLVKELNALQLTFEGYSFHIFSES